MRKPTFGMNLSLDGHITAPGDDLGLSVPSGPVVALSKQGWQEACVKLDSSLAAAAVRIKV